ncbi:MAG: hypothetical protein GXP28_04265 [Planctomycetes bacterium]|nr:hypothetical protein [Planctomycetota bacterium]
MRRFVLLALCVSLLSATTAEARLFWQTYGSTIPSESPSGEGCGAGCSWNWNQDYFVPRYPSSCRYGLFSPCKTSRSTSPACKWSHPFYPGYCSNYGPCHYRRRNHVYGARCGCSPIQVCGSQAAPYYLGDFGHPAPTPETGYLPNVESPGLAIVGSISVEGDGLLANLDLTPGDGPDEQRVFLGPQTLGSQTVGPNLDLPALMQQLEKSTSPLPAP